MKLVAKQAILWSTVGTVGAAAVVLPVVLTETIYDGRVKGLKPQWTFSDQNRELVSKTMGPIIEEVVKKDIVRTPNNNVYTSEPGRELLINKYPGFKYPAYNFRYNENKNNILNVNGKEINCSKAIHKEELFQYKSESLNQEKPQETRWSSEGFILDEIKYNRLKKHPAIEGMYRDMVQPNVNAVSKRFVLPSTIFGTNETGLYIPPGEIATITFGDEMHAWMQEHQDVPFVISLNNNAWNGKIDNAGKPNESYPMGGRYPYMRTDFGFGKGWFDKLEKLNPNDPNDKNKKIPKTFQFGSPFGGIININTGQWKQMTKKVNGVNKPINFSFTIDGAVQTMHYLDGVTTEQDWKTMVNEVYKKQRAPFFTANTFFYSFGFPFESKDNTEAEKKRVLVSDKDLKAINYPRKTFRKWFDFLFNSWYYSRGDMYAHRKIDMEFSDAADVWGGAAGWGGGDALYCSIGWAAFAFLSDVENWTYGGNWGVYHEINHNFEQNASFFREKGHGQTNEVTMGALSQINDTLRGRTEFDPLMGENSGWPALGNYYGLLNSQNKHIWQGEEYGYYQNLQYTFGPYNYINYVRYDLANHPNTDKNWTGISEIINLSNYLKLNLFPATYDYLEKNIWPQFKKDVKEPTLAEQKEITRIKKEYKTVDFVANLYAAGAYVFDSETSEYYYGGDSNPSFTIPFGEDYVFDMGKYTEVIRKEGNTGGRYNKDELSFDGIIIEPKSANGAQLIQDPNDPYKITYKPNFTNMTTVGLEDEFDVRLIVNDKYARKYNSVPEYRWKIKVRQETNAPTIEYFEQYSKRGYEESLKLIDDYTNDPANSQLKLVKKVPFLTKGLRKFLTNKPNEQELSRIKFKYVVQEGADYNISFKCDDQLRIKVRNETKNEQVIVGKQPGFMNEWTYVKDQDQKTIHNFAWSKNDVIDFEIVGVNTGGSGWYDVRLEKIDPETLTKYEVNWIKDSLSSNINEINKLFQLSSVTEFLTNVKYAYSPRQLDYSRLPYVNSRFLDVGGYGPTYIKKDDYEIYYQWPSITPDKATLNDKIKNDNEWWEDWSLKGKPAIFYIKLKQPQKLSGIIVKHRTNNHANERPTEIKITDLTNNKNTVLYSGEYGKEFNDRGNAQAAINFNQSVNDASIIKVEMVNKKPGTDQCLSLDSITPYTDRFYNFKVANSFAYNDVNISYAGTWTEKKNTIDSYQANMNNGYYETSAKDATISFGVYGNGFTLVGPLNNTLNAKFDVYINGELYKQDLTNKATDLDSNANLFTYVTPTSERKWIKVKIVVKEGTFLFNYINTYGEYSNLFVREPKKGTQE